jgi:hypothetical protein
VTAKGVLLVIYVYGDDGADEKRERVTSVAVVAGYDDWWQEVEDQWVARCGGIPFHAKDCESNWNDYRNISHDEAKALYRDLVGILASSKLGGIAVAIDLEAQKRLFPTALPIAYYKAFIECLDHISILCRNLGDMAELTFDISTENEYNARAIYRDFRESDREQTRYLSPKISFVTAREYPRVQVADLLAYESWKALDHTVGQIKRKRRSWELLRATDRFETLGYSERWFTDLKAHLDSGELEKKVGFNENDYKQWLKDKNRQHNLSNLFEFAGKPHGKK